VVHVAGRHKKKERGKQKKTGAQIACSAISVNVFRDVVKDKEGESAEKRTDEPWGSNQESQHEEKGVTRRIL